MSGQHYISKFHLSMFCDPESTKQNPWLWVGTTADGVITRQRPKNVGTVESLFDGPGGLQNPQASIETFLANEVEGPAAKALRKVSGDLNFSQLPYEVMKYLAWAASRSLPMQRLEAQWCGRFGSLHNSPAIEPPPPGLTEKSHGTLTAW